MTLGDVERASGELARAEQGYQNALLILRQVADLRGEAICLSLIGTLALERGKPAESIEPFTRAAELFDSLRMQEQARIAREHLASAAAVERA